MSAYDEFLAAMRRRFTPPKGAGRCACCAFHITTQGHRDGCPDDRGNIGER